MERFKLSDKSFQLINSIDFSEMGSSFRIIEAEKAVETTNVRLMQIIIDEEITAKGLDDDQNLCTEYGRKLYTLYDEILDQID